MPKKEQEVEMIKCTLKLPRHIWRESKIRAMDEDVDWQNLVASALKHYIKTVPLKEREKGGKL